MEEGNVTHSITDGIATIEFFHPKSNSLPAAVLRDLANTITEVGQNPEALVIVLKSKGEKAFCAGASFDELVAISNPTEGKEFFMGFARVINAARKCPKFIIGRIQGKAVGGGVGVAASTDYCFATSAASVKLSELAIGLGPFVVGPAVDRKVGTSAFAELAINATAWRDANWAHSRGLYNEVFENIEDLDAGIQELAVKLSKSNPEAMKMLKAAMWQGTEDWDQLLEDRAVMSGELVLSEFTSNAIASFKAGTR